MSSELRESLPILPDTDPDEAAHIRALLAVASADDQALAAAYEADAQALAAAAATQQGDHPALAGFADAVMAAVAEEPARPAAPEREERAPAPILRPAFGVQLWLAIAAMLMAALGLGIVAFDAPPEQQPIVAGDDTQPTAPQPAAEASPAPPSDARPLPAPKRNLRERRIPGARRGGQIVPVDGRGARQRDPLVDALRRMWQVREQRAVPPKGEDEREVKF